MAPNPVFISGAEGFIAQHIIKRLLANVYNVVGSVREASVGEQLKRKFNTDRFSYEVVEDIQKPNCFEQALKKHPEVKTFLHTANPCFFNTTDPENDILIPGVSGCKHAFHDIKSSAPQVDRVVLLSSIAATVDARVFDKIVEPPFTVTEKSWNPTTWEDAKKDGSLAYFGSKKFAEKYAWEFLENEKPNFKLSTINPVWVLGPQAFDEDVKPGLNFSNEFIGKLLTLKEGDQIPHDASVFIDVRDVARAVVESVEKPEIIGHRIIVSSGVFSSQAIIDTLNTFPEMKGHIVVGNPGSQPLPYNFVQDSVSRGLLGFKYYDLETTLKDTAEQYAKVVYNK